MKDSVKTYFDSYPKSNECFETSDGFLFHQEQKAEAYAARLKNSKVITHTRKVDTLKDYHFPIQAAVETTSAETPVESKEVDTVPTETAVEAEAPVEKAPTETLVEVPVEKAPTETLVEVPVEKAPEKKKRTQK